MDNDMAELILAVVFDLDADGNPLTTPDRDLYALDDFGGGEDLFLPFFEHRTD